MSRLKWRTSAPSTRHTTQLPRVFYWETPQDADMAIVAVAGEDGSLTVTVSEEQAVDSYNSYFDCSLSMPREQAERLRDLLNEWYPPK